MSGIINYFHGESGKVRDSWWELGDDVPAFAIAIEGDPHRTIAWDYGSDIGIDPRIAPGDDIVYLRLEDTAGIWVQPDLQSEADLEGAITRVLEHRRWIERWRRAEADTVYVDVAREIYESRGDPLRVTSTRGGDAAEKVLAEGWAILDLSFGGPWDDRPRAAASFFLSHASEDTLLARRIFHDLKIDANADIWFDLAQPREQVPKDDSAVGDWLRRSIRAKNGFVILWTEHAADSDWVRKELKWAQELGQSRPGFELILLRLRDVAVPTALDDVCTVIDCDQVWWSNGLNEELYAAVFKRPPRREWLASLSTGTLVSEGTMIGYDDFLSDAGVVVAFDWSFDSGSRRDSLRWQLEYRRRDGAVCRETGGGVDRAADLAIKPGDRVGFFKVRWRHGSHVREGPDLWMRSSDLALTSDMVLDHYYEALHGR